MKRSTWVVLFVFLCSSLTFAQGTGDYKRLEFFAGFSHNRVDTSVGDDDAEFGDLIGERTGFNGFNASMTGNVSRYVGLKFDFSGHYRSDTLKVNLAFPCQPAPLCLPAIVPADVRARASLFNFLGGVQFKDNTRDACVKPFGHLLVGAAHARFDVDDEGCVQAVGVPCPAELEDSETGFAGAFGGGLDVRLSDRVDFRAIQLDYNPTRINDATQHNFRIGIGIVFR
jgi:opacity protein-like surface antigen